MHGITRQLKKIGQGMDSMTSQKNLAPFLKSPENAQKVNSLVEDIRDSLMDYQVCSPTRPALIVANVPPDLVAARHLQRRLSTDRESYSPMVPPLVVTCK